MGKFYVNIPRHYYDSFGDNLGFETYKEARIEAKKMVREALGNLWKKGLTAENLLELYKYKGNHPTIDPYEQNKDTFNAIIYAEQIAAMICEKLENK